MSLIVQGDTIPYVYGHVTKGVGTYLKEVRTNAPSMMFGYVTQWQGYIKVLVRVPISAITVSSTKAPFTSTKSILLPYFGKTTVPGLDSSITAEKTEEIYFNYASFGTYYNWTTATVSATLENSGQTAKITIKSTSTKQSGVHSEDGKILLTYYTDNEEAYTQAIQQGHQLYVTYDYTG